MEKWEYIRFRFEYDTGKLTLPDGKVLEKTDIWEGFNKLGEQGWDMVTVIPISEPRFLSGYPGYTNLLYFIFKHQKE